MPKTHTFKIRSIEEVVKRLAFLWVYHDKLKEQLASDKIENLASLREKLENLEHEIQQLEWILFLRDDNGEPIIEFRKESEWVYEVADKEAKENEANKHD